MLALVISTIFTSSQPMPPLQFGAGGDDLVEIAIRGRLAVAGESDVVQPAQRLGRRAEFFGLVNPPAGDQAEHRVQLGQQRRHFDEPRFALLPAIDLAIDAIEIADLVGIEIHADRQPAAAAAQHRIDEPIRLERPLMHRMQRERHMRRNRIFGAGVHGLNYTPASAVSAANAALPFGCPRGAHTARASEAIARACARLACHASWQSDLNPPQLREFIHRDGRQFAIVASEDQHVAVDLVVRVAAEMQAVAAALGADDGADGARRPLGARADGDDMPDFDPVARLQFGKYSTLEAGLAALVVVALVVIAAVGFLGDRWKCRSLSRFRGRWQGRWPSSGMPSSPWKARHSGFAVRRRELGTIPWAYVGQFWRTSRTARHRRFPSRLDRPPGTPIVPAPCC